MKNINLKAIRIDGGTQSRAEINNEVVSEYAEAIKAGATFPPVTVFHDGADYWLADGFHRFHAFGRAGKTSIAAEVHQGTVRDAVLFSLGANPSHGLRRTNADKRKSVLTALNDAEWSEWSDRKIADACGVGHPFVAALRNPQVAEKQQENRNVSAAKKAAVVESDSTFSKSDGNEEQDAVQILSEENDRLNDRLAVAAMSATDEERALAADTIESLRAQVNTLTQELDAVKASRDSYMVECAELKKQCASQRKQIDKLKK